MVALGLQPLVRFSAGVITSCLLGDPRVGEKSHRGAWWPQVPTASLWAWLDWLSLISLCVQASIFNTIWKLLYLGELSFQMVFYWGWRWDKRFDALKIQVPQTPKLLSPHDFFPKEPLLANVPRERIALTWTARSLPPRKKGLLKSDLSGFCFLPFHGFMEFPTLFPSSSSALFLTLAHSWLTAWCTM